MSGRDWKPGQPDSAFGRNPGSRLEGIIYRDFRSEFMFVLGQIWCLEFQIYIQKL